MVLIPVVASDRLGVGDVAHGWLRAAPGVGAAAMAIVLAIRPVSRRRTDAARCRCSVWRRHRGLRPTRSYVVAFISLVVLSAADMVSMFIRGAIVLLQHLQSQLGG